MIFFRAIFTTAARYARHKPTPLIKNYPVTLRLRHPSFDDIKPTIQEFDSAELIETFLSEKKQFLIDMRTGQVIRPDQVHKIDPNVIYNIAGSGLIYREKPEGLSREQVWDRIFGERTANILKETLEAEDPNLKELSRVVRDTATGQDISEWEIILQGSDGSITFLETKYRMSKKHIDKQFDRLSKSLETMGKVKRAKLYLAAYYWPEDEDCISYACSKGYGVIQPNGSDLTIHSKAKELCLDSPWKKLYLQVMSIFKL